MSIHINEFDPGAAAWLRELMKRRQIPDGVVDERSILDVDANDVRGFVQCHFFGGIGGWPYALRLAGWPDDRRVMRLRGYGNAINPHAAALFIKAFDAAWREIP